MALNLMTVTLIDGKKIEVGVANIETIAAHEDGTAEIKFVSGHSIIVKDAPAKVSDRANYSSPG